MKERFYPIYRDEGIDWDFSAYEQFFHLSDDSLTDETLERVGYEAMLLEQVSRGCATVIATGRRSLAGLPSVSIRNRCSV